MKIWLKLTFQIPSPPRLPHSQNPNHETASKPACLRSLCVLIAIPSLISAVLLLFAIIIQNHPHLYSPVKAEVPFVDTHECLDVLLKMLMSKVGSVFLVSDTAIPPTPVRRRPVKPTFGFLERRLKLCAKTRLMRLASIVPFLFGVSLSPLILDT